MTRFDITRTNHAVERLIETTADPRHRYLLHVCNRYRYLGMAGRWAEILVPEMTVAEPVLNLSLWGQTRVVVGAEAVRALYEEWAAVGQSVFYTEGERIAVGDSMISSTATLFQQTPGEALVGRGMNADPDATYLLKNVAHLSWRFDDEGRLLGKDAWEIDPSTRDLIALDPAEVLTSEASADLLEPLIKPLPVRPF